MLQKCIGVNRGMNHYSLNKNMRQRSFCSDRWTALERGFTPPPPKVVNVHVFPPFSLVLFHLSDEQMYPILTHSVMTERWLGTNKQQMNKNRRAHKWMGMSFCCISFSYFTSLVYPHTEAKTCHPNAQVGYNHKRINSFPAIGVLRLSSKKNQNSIKGARYLMANAPGRWCQQCFKSASVLIEV